jgi:hypothetical protein
MVLGIQLAPGFQDLIRFLGSSPSRQSEGWESGRATEEMLQQSLALLHTGVTSGSTNAQSDSAALNPTWTPIAPVNFSTSLADECLRWLALELYPATP